MTIYNYIEFFFIILFFLEIGGGESKSKRQLFFYVESFVVFFILAFRNYNVGADSILYTNYYSDPSTYWGTMPWGFETFCNFLKLFSGKWQFFMVVTSIVSLIPFLYYVKKEAVIVSFPFLSFLFCWDLLWLLETPIKQTTAITFFFGGYLLINSDNQYKWLRKVLALGIIVFSILIHSTIVFVIFIFLIFHYVSFSRKWAVISIIISVVLSSSIITFIPILYDKLEMYSLVFQLFDNVQNHAQDVATGLITYDIKKYLLPSLYVIIVLMMCSEDEMKSLPAKCIVAGTIIFNLFIAFPNIPRVVLPLTLIGSSLYPCYYKRNDRKMDGLLVRAHILMIIMFYYLHLKKCIEFKSEMDADILPYSFWF